LIAGFLQEFRFVIGGRLIVRRDEHHLARAERIEGAAHRGRRGGRLRGAGACHGAEDALLAASPLLHGIGCAMEGDHPAARIGQRLRGLLDARQYGIERSAIWTGHA